jgi:hypothetical protein
LRLFYNFFKKQQKIAEKYNKCGFFQINCEIKPVEQIVIEGQHQVGPFRKADIEEGKYKNVRG